MDPGRIALVATLSGFFLATSAPEARAQQRADTSRLRSAMTPLGLFMTDGSKTLLPGRLSLGLTAHYAADPVSFRFPDFDDALEAVIEEQLFTDVAAAIGVLHRFDIGVVLPVALAQKADDEAGLGEISGGGFGDLRVMPRIQAIEQDEWGLDVVVIPELILPTGSEARLLGDPSLSFRPGVVLGRRFGPLKLVGNVAWRIRQNGDVEDVELTDELALSGGAAYDLRLEAPLPLTLLAEVTTTTEAGAPFDSGGQGGSELFAGARTHLMRKVVVTAGAAGGLNQAVGVPRWRALVSLAYAPSEQDRDDDGIIDDHDPCPFDAEDRDGYEDDDGCPDPDNDADGIVDDEDQCPDEAETLNDIQDHDGCPDEDIADLDGDGVPDIDDECRDQPEDLDGHQDDDGCPDPDNDLDGVPDSRDECPIQHETINGIDDDDGCPDEGKGLTEVVGEKIEIKSTVLFETAKSAIRDESRSLLNQVALTILAHPTILRVRVEGHTDNRGSAAGNLSLSQDRADSVRQYLIRQGVEAERLVAEGFGESRPIDTNSSDQGRARNRRVEFVILERSE